ncbi:Fatty-acid-CoA ligase [Entomortierella chlamydospora]|uniref:Fatty-acid-CoA ligase n=1 Tax=Entomortierella chlamydospora TaxID=101097 RepID=A0A9P6MV63_9FUNG|nr:Fatty-acid-CoA ligase [Entomortierella chlamydospora]
MPEIAHQSPNNLSTASLPSLRQLILVDNGTHVPETAQIKGLTKFEDLLVRNRSAAVDVPLLKEQRDINNRDIINIQFTSGTTGLPNLAAMTHGSSIVYPSESFDPEATLRAVSEEGVTALHGVPTMFVGELNHPNFSKYDYSTLRTGVAAGSPVPIEIMKSVESKMNLSELTICYGMTETSPVSFMSLTTDSLKDRCETVGRIMPHMEAKIVSPETGEIVPIGTSGEVCTRGYAVMEGGYWKSKAQTDDVVDSEGWMHTGDTGVLDEFGFCRIDGRIKDMVIRGGEKIHPVEVENCLFEVEGIQNVSVIGVPDKRYGEQVCAWITVKDGHQVTLDDIQKFCDGKIAHYKVPRHLIVVEPHEIPTTPSGKIQKNILRERSRQILQLEA